MRTTVILACLISVLVLVAACQPAAPEQNETNVTKEVVNETPEDDEAEAGNETVAEEEEEPVQAKAANSKAQRQAEDKEDPAPFCWTTWVSSWARSSWPPRTQEPTLLTSR